MTHCYDLMKEKAVLDSLDTGAEKQWIQEERRHHANMMKENEEWNQKVRTYGISFSLWLCVKFWEQVLHSGLHFTTSIAY